MQALGMHVWLPCYCSRRRITLHLSSNVWVQGGTGLLLYLLMCGGARSDCAGILEVFAFPRLDI